MFELEENISIGANIKVVGVGGGGSNAVSTMIAGGMKKKDRQVKGNVDKISATLILQSYLARRPERYRD